MQLFGFSFLKAIVICHYDFGPLKCRQEIDLEITLKNQNEKAGLGALLLILLRRLIALVFIFYAITYWARIVAFGDFVGAGIDTMPTHQQVVSVILAVTMPIAAIGLWGLFSWGTSTWLAVLAFEFTLFYIYPDLYGAAPYIVLFHLVSLATYLAIKATMMVTRNKSRSVSIDNANAG